MPDEAGQRILEGVGRARVEAQRELVHVLASDDVAPLGACEHDEVRIAVDGRSMLINQALEQFRLMTGEELSEALAMELLGMEDRA